MFKTIRDSHFDISEANAISQINTDKKKTMSQREEDKQFIKRLKENKFVFFGPRDLKFTWFPQVISKIFS